MTTETNISPRFGFNPGGFWRRFAANLVGADSGFPKTASLRASRAFNGSTRIVALADLALISLPLDFPITSGDPAVPGEDDLQSYYEQHFPLANIPVMLGDSPAVSLASTQITVPGFAERGTGRRDVCRLAAARALGLEEIAIEVRWI